MTKVKKVRQVLLVYKVIKEYLEQLVKKAIKELQVQLAIKDLLAHKVHKVKKEKLD